MTEKALFGDTLAHKRIMKRKKIMEDIEKAKKDKDDWKVRQLEGKFADINSRFYPNMFWDSRKKGTYHKPEEVIE